MAGNKTLEHIEPQVQMYGLKTNKAAVLGGGLTVTGNISMSTTNATITFTGTGTSGGIITNPYNAAATTLSGTQRDIQIKLGTVPYYFTVYPTKA